jgi:hypothetical protein
MQTIKQNVIHVMDRLTFPTDAQAVFADAMDTIAADAVATAWLKRLIEQYETSERACHYKRMLADSRAIGTVLGIHEHTMELLLFLCLCEPLRRRYADRGIDESIWLDSMMDLRYKLEECRLVMGTVGSFVAPWFGGFFDMTRFALGRLQFEIVHTSKDYTVGGIAVPAGSPAINMHIPRTGTRLDHTEVMASYRKAAEWFADVFPDGTLLFTCSSWLLDPWNLTALKPTSNLAAFIGDFEIVSSGSNEGYGELWRLFDCNYTGNPADLPRDSSLRRAYADRVARGEPIGHGRGFFRMRDGEIIR